MKRLLIIAYYWPPSAGSGVQRWLKFAKYLPQYGWKPIVYTPENPDFKLQDESLLNDIPEEAEIIKNKIWEPYSVHRMLLGNKSSKNQSTGVVENKSSWKSKISNWLRGNLFIPDPKVFWVKPSVRYLSEYLKKNPVDAIVSTGTPHSMHLIGKAISEQFNLPWIADFRDPMSQLDMLKNYNITKRNFEKYEAIEQAIIRNADITLTTSEVWKAEFSNLGAKRAECITNGYDESDFTETLDQYSEFVISHFGLLNHLRNPESLWKALSELCEENSSFRSDFKLHLGGSIDPEILKRIHSYPHLEEAVKVFDYLSHQEVIQEYLKSSVLLLLLFNSESGRGNIPGKLFEYLAAKRSIIAFGNGRGDSQRIIEESQIGNYFDYTAEVPIIRESIREIYLNRENKSSNERNTAIYSRKALTEKLVSLLESIVIN